MSQCFAEPPVDDLYREELPLQEGDRVFGVEFLPGQFDQRADSAVQCVRFLKEDEEPIIRTAVIYVISGKITDDEFAKSVPTALTRWIPGKPIWKSLLP